MKTEPREVPHFTFDDQLAAYLRLRKKLGWQELRGFTSSSTPGAPVNDCWMQRRGIAVWVNPGLNIGLKNSVGSGYGGLENRGSKGLNHPPRSKMSWEEIVPLWREGYESIKDFRLACRLAIILSELQILCPNNTKSTSAATASCV
ncbi:MAG: hypothetical protein A2Y38_01340 [Spirochaetes bacterium GWB1_59_5]|nr:MAG: hypothetical protein A2Y38_01340 [Spirochaetes bacterium GWB1_59_5]